MCHRMPPCTSRSSKHGASCDYSLRPSFKHNASCDYSLQPPMIITTHQIPSERPIYDALHTTFLHRIGVAPPLVFSQCATNDVEKKATRAGSCGPSSMPLKLESSTLSSCMHVYSCVSLKSNVPRFETM